MKKLVLLIALLLFITQSSCSLAQEKFPIEYLHPQIQESDNAKIVLVIPTVSDSTEYASMLVESFKRYFVEKYAFNTNDRDSVNIDIVLLSSNPKTILINNSEILQPVVLSSLYYGPNLFDTKDMFQDTIPKEVLSQLNIPEFKDNNASSILFLLDSYDNIILRDDDYRAQGEHLKPLEYRLKELLGVSTPNIEKANRPNLKIGDKAPTINSIDFRDKISLLTFYPAAFSGIIRASQPQLAKSLDIDRINLTCAVQIPSLDKISLQTGVNKTNYYAISESTPELLEFWKQTLNTYHINYVNDPNYDIAQAFGAYNENKYANRMTVIVDQKGNIAYIDADYTIEKEDNIKEVVNKLLGKITFSIKV